MFWNFLADVRKQRRPFLEKAAFSAMYFIEMNLLSKFVWVWRLSMGSKVSCLELKTCLSGRSQLGYARISSAGGIYSFRRKSAENSTDRSEAGLRRIRLVLVRSVYFFRTTHSVFKVVAPFFKSKERCFSSKECIACATDVGTSAFWSLIEVRRWAMSQIFAFQFFQFSSDRLQYF